MDEKQVREVVYAAAEQWFAYYDHSDEYQGALDDELLKLGLSDEDHEAVSEAAYGIPFPVWYALTREDEAGQTYMVGVPVDVALATLIESIRTEREERNERQ